MVKKKKKSYQFWFGTYAEQRKMYIIRGVGTSPSINKPMGQLQAHQLGTTFHQRSLL